MSEPTFETTRGSSYVDLMIANNQLFRRVTDWTYGIQESCSEHKTFNCENNKDGLEKLDQELCNKINFYEDVDELVDMLSLASQQHVIRHSRYQE